MKKEYDLIVYIGRFQPFHTAHKATITHAEEIADNVIVLIGSASSSRSPKNPFTYNEREMMIYNEFQDVYTSPLNDFTYDNSRWVAEVGKIVEDFIYTNQSFIGTDINKIGVIGHDKDHSSFYLNYFPQWNYIDMPVYPDHGESIDATKIRDLLFKGDYNFIKGVVPEKVYESIIDFTHSDHFKILKDDYDYVQDYKESWKAAPYAPTFVTVDSVVVQSGHVLLIQRGASPGYGMWAMPGGFIDQYELLRDASVRELREETKLKIPKIILEKAISDKDTEVFDNPSRSSRGRTITHAFLYILDDAQKLPRVKGSDDAMEAKWVSFTEFEKMESEMFEDHYAIVMRMIGKV